MGGRAGEGGVGGRAGEGGVRSVDMTRSCGIDLKCYAHFVKYKYHVIQFQYHN